MNKTRFTGARLLKGGAIVAAMAAMALSVLAGCENPANNGAGAGPQFGTLALTIDNGPQGRTIMPTWPDDRKVDLEFTHATDSSQNEPHSDWDWKLTGTQARKHLATGNWTVKATAYTIGADGIAKDHISEATATFDIGANAVTGVTLTFKPIVTAGAGKGTFSWDLSDISEAVKTASFRVFDPLDQQNVIPPTNLFLEANSKGSESLDVGYYQVHFTLAGDPAKPWETTTLITDLHIYLNLDSELNAYYQGIFANFEFPEPVVRRIARSYDPDPSVRWDFDETGIKAGHFPYAIWDDAAPPKALAGIDGETTDEEFGHIVRWFNLLSTSNSTPYDIARLPTLVDAALLGRMSERPGFLPGANNKMDIETAIMALTMPNGTVIEREHFTWRSAGADTSFGDESSTLWVRVGGAGGYLVTINFVDSDGEPLPMPQKSYAITYVGFDMVMPENTRVTHGDLLVAPTMPSENAAQTHRFDGWYSVAVGKDGKVMDDEDMFDFTAPITEDKTIYANEGLWRRLTLDASGSAVNHSISGVRDIVRTGTAPNWVYANNATQSPGTTSALVLRAVAGDEVTLNAGTHITSGMSFQRWSPSTIPSGVAVEFSTLTQSTTSFTMPAAEVYATGSWQAHSFTITIQHPPGANVLGSNSYLTVGGVEGISGSSPANGAIRAVPGARANYTFVRWEVVAGGVTLSAADPITGSVTFTMPASNVILATVWALTPGADLNIRWDEISDDNLWNDVQISAPSFLSDSQAYIRVDFGAGANVSSVEWRLGDTVLGSTNQGPGADNGLTSQNQRYTLELNLGRIGSIGQHLLSMHVTIDGVAHTRWFVVAIRN